MSKNTKKNPRILILIDGSNFYHLLKRAGVKHQLSFDYSSFFKWLTSSSATTTNYHIGAIRQEKRNPKSIELYTNQTRLFAHLTRHYVHIFKGYMLKYDGSYHEKGVDVQIALDIAIGAYEDSYDECYLISSDTDLIPAIKIAIRKGKKVFYVGSEKFLSNAMIYNCSAPKKILKQSDLALFVK